MRKLFGFIFTIYAFAVFISIMFILLPFIIVASFFGKVKGGNIIYKLCTVWAWLVLLLLGIRHKNIYEKALKPEVAYIFVFNHISYLDIPVILLSIQKRHYRILGKAEMGKIPIFGFIYSSAAVLVDRSNAEKRAKSVAQLKSIVNKGISVVIAPEGTFNTTQHPLKEFYDGAFKIAIETETPILPILFLDTYDRLSFHSIFLLNPGKSRSVFLDEIPVKGLTLNDVDFLKEKVYKVMEDGLIRYKASWIKGI